MTSEFLLDAIGQMDDELVLEAAVPARRTIPWLKVSGWAAALVLCVGVASLPGLPPMNGAGSGAAAPEADMILGDIATGGTGDYKYTSDQESQRQEISVNKSEAAGADGAAHDFIEPRFFTKRGVYLLTADPSKPKLPNEEEARELGVLVAAVPGKQVYPSTGTQSLVGCPVWESVDGKFLYVQLPDGSWLFAQLYESKPPAKPEA